MIYFKVIAIKPSEDNNNAIHLGWWPVFSVTLSIVATLVSFLNSTKLFNQSWCIRMVSNNVGIKYNFVNILFYTKILTSLPIRILKKSNQFWLILFSFTLKFLKMQQQ
jgi:hypothetical protein